MRVIVENNNGDVIFSYASPNRNAIPAGMQTMCALHDKKGVIIELAESIQALCDSQFPIP